MKQGTRYAKRLLNLMLVLAMVVSTFAGIVPATTIVASAQELPMTPGLIYHDGDTLVAEGTTYIKLDENSNAEEYSSGTYAVTVTKQNYGGSENYYQFSIGSNSGELNDGSWSFNVFKQLGFVVLGITFSGNGTQADPYVVELAFGALESTWDGQGDGTEDAPYLIGNLDELKTLASNVNSGMTYSGKYLQLTADIDCGSDNWISIGGVGHPFNGTFDGNGKTITYQVAYSNAEWGGLFGQLGASATVKNLNVSATIFSSSAYVSSVGGIAGRNYGTITNCYSHVEISGQGSTIGGICGTVSDSGTISYCVASGSISTQPGVFVSQNGGIAGVSSATMTHCVSLCDVTAIGVTDNYKRIGAVVGDFYNSTPTECYYLSTATFTGYGINTNGATAKTADELKAIGEGALLEGYDVYAYALGVEKHTHTWNYAANGNTITATCTGEGDCDYKTDGITLTLNAPTSLGYDGSEKAITVSGYPNEAPAGLAAAPTAITYYPAAEKGSATIGGAALAGAPVEVGSYVACVTWGEQTASVPYTVVNYVSDYTVVIPSSLPVRSAGWNATEGLQAQVKQTTGYEVFAPEKCIVVTAASANDWALVSGENAIGYILTTAEGGAQTTEWKFYPEELDAGTTKTMGIILDDYSTAPMGTYTDTVTFTVSVVLAGDVRVSKEGEDDVLMSLTEYRDAANDGEYEGWTVTLLHDVDLKGELWTPIEGFSGTFDGDYYRISNLKIEAPDGIGAFFGSCADNATIKNVVFEKVNVSGKYVAVVVGDAEQTKNLTISDIYVLSGEVSAATGYAAGIVFDAEGEGLTLQRCENYATIEGWSASGIGAWVYPKSGSDVSYLYNYGTVTATNRAGGIFGNWGGANLSYCHNAGNVTVIYNRYGEMPAGGIVGIAGAKTTIEYCLNEGTVRNLSVMDQYNASAGGILGQNPGSAVTIRYCINYGDVYATNCAAAGIGVSLYGGITAVKCHNEASVEANDTNGGTKSYAAGIVAADGMFGGPNSTTCCLDNSQCLSATQGARGFGGVADSCYVAANASNSFYFDEDGILRDAAGNEVVDPDAALVTLNEEGYFFYIDEFTGMFCPNNPFYN